MKVFNVEQGSGEWLSLRLGIPTASMAPSRELLLLSYVGELLYGPQWQCALARALGVSDRSMRYWLAGRRVPEGVLSDLRRLAEERYEELGRLLDTGR